VCEGWRADKQRHRDQFHCPKRFLWESTSGWIPVGGRAREEEEFVNVAQVTLRNVCTTSPQFADPAQPLLHTFLFKDIFAAGAIL
jgi:hypothetical protein